MRIREAFRYLWPSHTHGAADPCAALNRSFWQIVIRELYYPPRARADPDRSRVSGVPEEKIPVQLIEVATHFAQTRTARSSATGMKSDRERTTDHVGALATKRLARAPPARNLQQIANGKVEIPAIA
jgi:hypothetical protein